jgi:hypothetical protein
MTTVCCGKFQFVPILFLQTAPKTRIYTFVPYKKKRFFADSERFYESKKQILAQKPGGVMPSLSGFLDKFASFPRLVCQTNVLKPLSRK